MSLVCCVETGHDLLGLGAVIITYDRISKEIAVTSIKLDTSDKRLYRMAGLIPASHRYLWTYGVRLVIKVNYLFVLGGVTQPRWQLPPY